ncbi:hypothetical protein AAFC00_005604 [Neodothiora populina]|uniref:NADP-dependent oxidoreductase domain-containing protein n=1 Tax=Neodothiora populina TaxID=2781224 RepID=A0ABR3PLG5_9PEZI
MPQLVGKEVGELGYGLMGLTWRASPPTQETSFRAMKASLAVGSNFWNGGELYGTPERNSLHLLYEYFFKYPEDAEKVVLSIKGGLERGQMAPNGTRENVRRSIDECLNVLDGKKFLDLFECARVDPKTPIETTIEAIAEYIKEGKLGGISLSECSADTIRRAAKVHKISAVEVEYSLWATDIEKNGVAEACAELKIPIIAYSPLGRGFLTGQIKSFDDLTEADFRRTQPRFQGENFEKNMQLVRDIQKIADKKGCTPGQIATSWILTRQKLLGTVIIPIPGSSTEERVKENSVVIDLSEDDLSEVNSVLKSATIVGGRYGGPGAALEWGNSAPLQ